MKNFVAESKIIKWIILLPIIGVILTSFILTNIFISSKHKAHNLEIVNIEKNHISNLKGKIEERIKYISLLLSNNYINQLLESKKEVKDKITIGYAILENIYQNNKHLSKNELYKVIDESMRNIRFFDNKTGYFFIQDISSGTAISMPANPNLVGKDIRHIVDKKGMNLYDSFMKVLDKDNEGYHEWYWNKPNSNIQSKKIGYIKKFEPLNLYIGTAIYLEDLRTTIVNENLNFVNTLEYNDNSYIFIMNSKGTALVHKNKKILDVPLEKLDKKIKKNVEDIITKAKKSNNAFIEYTQSEELFKDINPSKKISYIKYIPILDWVIGTGLYTDKLNQQIKQKRMELKITLEDDIKTIIKVSALVSFIIIILIILLSKRIKKLFKFYSQRLEEANIRLKNLNDELEKKVKEQVSDIREKDIILNQQSKLAAMGEMLGNIAHQWRQPLSAISTLASGIRVQKEMNLIDDKQVDADLQNIVKSTSILSKTIDDFRNFYSQKKVKNEFELNNTINQVLSLISANIKNHYIELIIDIEDVKLNTYENELVQVILNIMNNAKDALIDKNDPKLIFIKTYKKENIFIIEIFDNAGGIKNDIIDRIFEPYFTTKFKAQGTGIGLYMTKNIIENSLKGDIQVKNNTFQYKDKEYLGALFKIELPLS
ncbi:MAG: hypothetical protein C0625_03310 [Arcobacter sp.]|nr:MAG: hypothetical protein C0625_03310 [Arcobacter sp.]